MDIVHRCHFHGCTTPTPRKWLYETIHTALFMDLRDELKQLNKNLIQQRELLQSIRRNTAWSRKKREAE